VPILPAAGRHDLADDEWRVLGALLPREKKPGRTPRWSRRQRNRMLGPSGPVTPPCRHDTSQPRVVLRSPGMQPRAARPSAAAARPGAS
jgi:transposase